MKEDHRSIIGATLQLRKEILKKFRRVRDSSPSPLLYRFSAPPIELNKPTESWSLSLNWFNDLLQVSSLSFSLPSLPARAVRSFPSSTSRASRLSPARVPLSPLSLGNSWESPWSNLRSGSIFVSLRKLHSGGQGETKRD